MTRRIALVDALRGLAAATVVFHHVYTHFPRTFAAIANAPVQRACSFISDRNVEAVLLFFVVSGFSIRLSGERLDLTRRADVNEYIYRRLKRILPLYLFALAFSALVVLALGVPTSKPALAPFTLLGNLAFLQSPASVRGGWFVPFADNGPLWSLSFEMFYYCLFPAHHRLIRGHRARFVSAWAISGVGLACNMMLPNPLAQFAALYAVWYCGVELAQSYLSGNALPLSVSVPLWCSLTLARFAHLSNTLESLWFGAALLLAGQALVALNRRLPGPHPAWIGVAMKPFTWIGSFSYALYLLHFPIVAVAAQARGDEPLSVALAVMLSAAIAVAAERASLYPRYGFLRRSYV